MTMMRLYVDNGDYAGKNGSLRAKYAVGSCNLGDVLPKDVAEVLRVAGTFHRVFSIPGHFDNK